VGSNHYAVVETGKRGDQNVEMLQKEMCGICSIIPTH